MRLNPIAAFNFIGSAAFSSSAGQLRSQNIGGAVWLVEGDTNGDAVADFAVHVTVADADPITNADFLL